ncbi:MAG: hypothetical protein J6B85_07845 [Lachnospiraceae bacterium]|nr:hypothetical protein [Lachnospiraceae bacterium]
MQTEEGYEFSLPGKYQIIVSIPSGWSQEKTAVYHIGTNGLITRLSGEYRKNGSTVEFTALADDIGSFAVVHLDTMSERVDSSWLEEMHVQYDSAPEPEGSSSSYSEGTGRNSGNGTSSGGNSGSGSDGRNSGTDTSGNPAAGEPSEELTVLIRYDFEDGAVTIAIPERKESEEANVPAVRKPDSQEASMEAWREYQSEKSAQSGQKDTSSGTDEQKDNAETGADGGDSGTESGADSTSSQALQEAILEITTFQKKEEIVMTAEGENAGRTPQIYRITEEKDGEISFESVKVKKDKDSGGYRATLKKAGRYYVVYGEDLAEQGMSLWLKVLLVIGGIVVFRCIVRTMVRKKRRKRRRNGSSAGTTAGSGKSE